jgi:hypothetical protein
MAGMARGLDESHGRLVAEPFLCGESATGALERITFQSVGR